MSVKVHNKQGKVICKIERPAAWKDILLSFTPVSRGWKEPLEVERWAVEAARQIAHWEAKGYELSIENGVLLYDPGALCPACLNYSITPLHYRRHLELVGYSCDTEDCPMRNLVIPKILVERVDELPCQEMPRTTDSTTRCIRCGNPVQRIYQFDGKKLYPPVDEIMPTCICDKCWKDALCSNCDNKIEGKPHLLIPITRAPDSKKFGELTLCDRCYAKYKKEGEIARKNVLEADEIEI